MIFKAALTTLKRRVILLTLSLILFVFTFAVNFLARWAIARSERKFA